MLVHWALTTSKLRLPGRELEKQLDFRLAKNNLLITFIRPLEKNASSQQVNGNLALSKLKDWPNSTMPNADTESRTLVNQIKEFCRTTNKPWPLHLS